MSKEIVWRSEGFSNQRDNSLDKKLIEKAVMETSGHHPRAKFFKAIIPGWIINCEHRDLEDPAVATINILSIVRP